MSLLTTQSLSKSFASEDIFDDINVEIPHGARIALVGPNGAGKTTLIRILLGLDEATEGTIARARGLRMGYLPQRPEVASTLPLWDEMLNAFARLRQMEDRLHDLAAQFADRADDAALMTEYGELQHAFELAGGYDYETRIKQVLQGLGFDADDYHKPMPILSGGQKTRAFLAKLLLEAPDLLVLDEPTNHLDIQAVEWLETYLNSSYEGAMLIVSHDRYFMDRVVNHIWELNFGRIETYRGNYSTYLEQREVRWQHRFDIFDTEKERLLRELDYIKKNIVRDSTNPQAVGRLRRLSRELVAMQQLGVVGYKGFKNWSQTGIGGVRLMTVYEAEAAIKALKPATVKPQERKLRLKMKASGRSGDKVLMTDGLVVGYEKQSPLFHCPDLILTRGETAAIIGPNGVGKSTFLKTLLGQLAPLQGTARLGASVKIGYFAQAHELLDENHTIMDEILSLKNMPISQVRDYMANFMFTGEDVFRPIKTLSGGERGRVALAKLALDGANFLLLDEPTNHLDIPAQEVLQDMLAEFDGTILLVSHDRYLINALATQIWAVSSGKLEVHEGNYQSYVAEREAAKQAATIAAQQKQAERKQEQRREASNGLNPKARQQKLEAVEATIAELEARLAQLDQDLADASAAGQVETVRRLGEAYAAAQEQLNAQLAEWEVLAT